MTSARPRSGNRMIGTAGRGVDMAERAPFAFVSGVVAFQWDCVVLLPRLCGRGVVRGQCKSEVKTCEGGVDSWLLFLPLSGLLRAGPLV